MKIIKLEKRNLEFKDNQIEGFIVKEVTTFGNGAKVDVPKKYKGRKAYIVIPNGKRS